MKKIVLLLLASAILFSCSKENLENETRKEIVFDIQVSQKTPVASASTKAVKTDFTKGDKVYVFFDDVQPTKHLTLTRQEDGSWTSEMEGDLVIDDLSKSGKNMHAIFFPFEQPVVQDDGTGVSFMTNRGLFIYTYNMTAEAPYSVVEKEDRYIVTGKLSMNSSAGYVQFFIDRQGGNFMEDKQYRLSVEGLKPVTCTGFYDNEFTYKELAAGQPLWGYQYEFEGVSFTGVPDESWSDPSNSHTMYLFDTKAAAKKKVFSGKTLSAGNAIRLTNINNWEVAVATPATVDLGCGTCLWGTFNLGASTPAEKGMYFSWGNIVPTTNGTQEYYETTVGYEVFKDRKASLTGDYSIYDAATAFLGPGWRIMTDDYNSSNDEKDYLLSLTSTWDDTQKARIFTGNDQSIILPASGNYNTYGFIAENVYGWYRSSGHYPASSIKSFSIQFHSTQVTSYITDHNYGQSIRPVKDK